MCETWKTNCPTTTISKKCMNNWFFRRQQPHLRFLARSARARVRQMQVMIKLVARLLPINQHFLVHRQLHNDLFALRRFPVSFPSRERFQRNVFCRESCIALFELRDRNSISHHDELKSASTHEIEANQGILLFFTFRKGFFS
jgi:hypothetical protein